MEFVLIFSDYIVVEFLRWGFRFVDFSKINLGLRLEGKGFGVLGYSVGNRF